METIRSDFALDLEADGAGGMVGIQSARGNLAASNNNPLNFSLRNFGTELRFGTGLSPRRGETKRFILTAR